MNLMAIMRTSWKDLFNLRVPADGHCRPRNARAGNGNQRP